MRRSIYRSRPLAVELLERREVLHAGILATATLETNFGDIAIEFRDDAAPETVENFLNYVKDGDYVNSIFHRLAAGFVLQGGGFNATTDQFPTDPTTADPMSFGEIPTDPTVVNEFNISNTRGTVAMAKLGSDPNSATNQYYINLQDNSNLDNQNGGFTVFGEIVDMTNVDQIASFPTHSFSSLFSPSDRRSAIGAVPYQPDGAGTKIVRIEQVTLSEGIVHGTVFLDVDRDGVQDAAEGGRGGVVIYDDANNNGALDAAEKRTTTDETGVFHLKYATATDYRLRTVDLSGYSPIGGDPVVLVGSIDRALNDFNMDFATRYDGVSYHNNRTAANVDGVNGVTPLDALLVINELDNRIFSDPDTGELFPLIDPLNAPRFIDVDNNKLLAPIDALLVINDLNEDTAAAALSASAGDATEGRNAVVDVADIPTQMDRPRATEHTPVTPRLSDHVASPDTSQATFTLNRPRFVRNSGVDAIRDVSDEAQNPDSSTDTIRDAMWAEFGTG